MIETKPKTKAKTKISIKLLTASEYYQELLDAIKNTQERIVICSMTTDSSNKVSALLDQIEAALKRGVSVVMIFDKYGVSLLSEGNLANVSRRNSTINRLNELKRRGAEIHIVGGIGLNPYANRMHIKATVLDDVVYTFGGVNFQGSFANNDIMFKVENKSILDFVLRQLDNVKSGEVHDKEAVIDHTTSALIDGGVHGRSIIYERALELANKSKEIYLVSRMCPSGSLGSAISDLNGSCYFNRPSHMTFPTNYSIIIDQLRTGVKNQYLVNKNVHAKFILFKHLDGTKSFISGSNNFNWRGVKFGTKEIAVYSKDEQLWQELYDYMLRLNEV